MFRIIIVLGMENNVLLWANVLLEANVLVGANVRGG